jgi:ferritin-like metal-binding protein YciE
LFRRRERSSEQGSRTAAAACSGLPQPGAALPRSGIVPEPAGAPLVVSARRVPEAPGGRARIFNRERHQMAVKTVQDLLIDELRDIYHAEKQLVKALPKMAKAVKSTKLRQAFEQHVEETRGQIERLEQVFEHLEVPARAKRCEAMAGLVEEAQEMMDEIKTPEVLDVALISAAQKVEHYEIASYGSVHALAQASGHEEAAQLLSQTLEEEKATDQKLNQIALSEVNKTALEKAA